MIAPSVCAIVVTYHPTARMSEQLVQIRIQVSGMVLVDNGSDSAELAYLRSICAAHNMCLVENSRNLGLAEALNQGVRRALADRFEWVALFDQDSRVTPQFVRDMLADWECHPHRDRIGSLHPRYVDPVTGKESYILRAKDGGPFKSMTSGSLMPSWIFEKIGFFASEYFIDEVDTEYCFRIRAAGYLVADSKRAILLHHVGHPKPFSIIGFQFRPTHHSATRRYYMSRNRLAVYRKYFFHFPRCVLYCAYESFRETVKCILGEPDRGRKLRNALLGAWDGLKGRMGERVGI